MFTQAEEGLGCLRLGDRLHTSRELQERMVEVLAQLTFPLLSTRLRLMVGFGLRFGFRFGFRFWVWVWVRVRMRMRMWVRVRVRM